MGDSPCGGRKFAPAGEARNALRESTDLVQYCEFSETVQDKMQRPVIQMNLRWPVRVCPDPEFSVRSILMRLESYDPEEIESREKNK